MNLEAAIVTGIWALWATYSQGIQESVIRKLGDKASKTTKEAVQAVWDRVDWNISASKYQKKVQEIYGTTRILGKPEPVSLEGIFTDVVILETPTALNRYDIKLLRGGPEPLGEMGPRKEGLGLVKNTANNRLFILGKPGAGKTTFLKYLAIQAAKGELEKTPIFVPLKEWADSELELMDFLVRQFDVCDFPDAQPFVEHVLRKGDALVLFDGLDEVNQEGHQRSSMISALQNFSNKYSDTQCLVTCRVAATEYTFDRFTYVELADFTDRQVITFVKKWFKGAPKKRKLFNDAFNRPENKGLRELARTPLLLSLLCLSFDATLDFPQRRVEIYEEALEALLKKWDSSRSIKRDEIYRGLSLGLKRHMFARIAAQFFQDGDYLFTQTALSKQILAYLRQLPGAGGDDGIDGDTVLKAIEAQHGIFTERAHRIYSFSHLTFQEYFTAKHIVADTTGKALHGLLAIENITDDRWREVILLTVSLLDNSDDFFEIFMSSLSKLASKEPLFVSLLKWVKQKTEAHSDSAAALKSYYCYLILSLIAAPSFSNAYRSKSSATSSLSFTYNYSLSHIIEICFALALKLDRSHSLNEAITQDTLNSIKMAHQELRTGKNCGLDLDINLPHSLKTDIGLYLSYTYFFAVTIANLREQTHIHPLINEFRSYFVSLRTYANSQEFKAIGLALNDIAIPPETAPDPAWASFIEKIHALVMSIVGSEKLLTKEQHKKIITFLIAARLLVDCLSLAVVSDRASMEDRLLLPPNETRRGSAQI